MFQDSKSWNYSSSSFEPTNVRKFWAKTSLKSKKSYSGSQLISQLLIDDARSLGYEIRCNIGIRNFFRMSSMEFERILNMIGPKLAMKEITDLRKIIPIDERLGITLRFLTSGDSFHSLIYTFKLPKTVILKVIKEVCSTLVDELQDYVKIPRTETDWRKTASTFYKKWGFPNCVGCIDGKQLTFQVPFKNGSEFFNCKGFFRIILFSVIDSDYNFIYINIGCQERISDGGIFRETQYKKVLEENLKSLPADSRLPGRTVSAPFVFLADEAFPLTPAVMKPYPGFFSKKSKKGFFNNQLHRSRRVSDNVFGIISTAFRVLRKPMLLEPETVKIITLTTLFLHNFLRKSPSKNIYNPPGTYDEECPNTSKLALGLWRQDEPGGFSTFPSLPKRNLSYAEYVRNLFAEYFYSLNEKK